MIGETSTIVLYESRKAAAASRSRRTVRMLAWLSRTSR